MNDEQLDALWHIAEDAKQFPQESDHIWKLGTGMPWDECGPIVTDDNELTIVDEMRLPRREFGKHIATFDPPTVQSLIQSLRAERAAHQATRAELDECTQMLVRIEPKIDQITQRVTAQQAELEAAREIVELVRKEGMYWPDVQAMADARLADYDATRAGQGEGAE